MRCFGVDSYGTQRCDCTASNNGGKFFGDRKLTVLHLESGACGGCTKTEFGETNGGAIKTNCCNSFIIASGASITANGDDLYYCGGMGSGGSI